MGPAQALEAAPANDCEGLGGTEFGVEEGEIVVIL
jgi:hypothetical protein